MGAAPPKKNAKAHTKVLSFLSAGTVVVQTSLLELLVESAVARLLERKQLVKNIDDRRDLCLPQIFIDGLL